MWTILNIVFVLSAVVFWPFHVNDSFWAIKEVVFVTGVLSLFAYSFYSDSVAVRFKNKYLALFLFYIFLQFSYFFYSSFITANGKVSWNFWNFRPTINILCAALLIKILFEYGESLKGWITNGKVIAWVGGIFAVYAILQYFSIDPIFNREGITFKKLTGISKQEVQMVTFFGSGFITSQFLALCAPMCLIFKGLKYRIMYVLILIALIFLNKTMALLAFGVGLSVYLLMKGDWTKLVSFGAISFMGGIFYAFKNPSFFSMSGRWPVWTEIWNNFLDKPFFGHGLGYFEMLGIKSGKVGLNVRDVSFAHNEFLQGGIDLGLFGMAIVALFLFGIFRMIVRSDRNIILIGHASGLASFLVLCIGCFPTRIAPLALLGIIYISGILLQCKGEYNV